MKLLITIVFLIILSACGGEDNRSGKAPNGGRATSVAAPTFTGPIGDAGLYGHPLWDSPFDISEIGYLEEEYFVSGTAQSSSGGPAAPYTTRVIVRRPADAAAFNGTVVLDWVNVTAQFENAVQTLEVHEFFHREGYAYVHMSAQAAGLCCTPGLTPQAWDPVRYADLSHPGDDYAYDMVSQIAAGFKFPGKVNPMGGLVVEKLIAVGQSQSASRLYGYVNEVQATANVIDGFLIQAGGGKDYGDASPAPVIHLLGDREADLVEPTTDKNYRLWEVAGAPHQNFWVGEHQVFGQSGRVTLHIPKQPMSADEDLHQTTANYGEQPEPGAAACILAGSLFPTRYAVAAAIHQLNNWVRGGATPPQPPRYEFTTGETLAVDELGNALGGLRYPVIDVPVARYLSDSCDLGGITVPLSDLELLQRYPSHADYRCQMQAATQRTVAAGFLLPADAQELLARVDAAANRWAAAGGASGDVTTCQ